LLIASDQRSRFADWDGKSLDRDRALHRACTDLTAQLTEPRPGAMGSLPELATQLVEFAQLGVERARRFRRCVEYRALD
jgi:hypothetical protein